jgi:CheY-like chemotaxis protein
LGLTISRNFARLMNGDLVVVSGPGQGSVFTFSFVASRVESVDMAAPEDHEADIRVDPAQASRRVLIVDDVATNRELLAEVLERAGFQTRTADSGAEALQTCEAWNPDAVLMDLRMPGMDGIETARQLRKRGSRTAIIAVTASSLAPAEIEAREAGADGYLRKPYRDEDLFAVLGERLGVRYVNGREPAPGGLAAELAALPDELVESLRNAALQGRAQRLELLAADVEKHSVAASDMIRRLARDFAYDTLVSALRARPN